MGSFQRAAKAEGKLGKESEASTRYLRDLYKVIGMGRRTHYGKPSNYPYYFRAERGKADVFISGTFKTKKAVKLAAESYAPRAKPPYRIRIIDRRR
jgi:hypothetical protein